MQLLSEFNLVDDEDAADRGKIHVCGEAYSDYHGFIEGSLRSAAHVLHRIDGQHPTLMPWQCPCDTCKLKLSTDIDKLLNDRKRL